MLMQLIQVFFLYVICKWTSTFVLWLPSHLLALVRLSSPLSNSISPITITPVEGSPQKLTLFFRATQERFSNYFLHRSSWMFIFTLIKSRNSFQMIWAFLLSLYLILSTTGLIATRQLHIYGHELCKTRQGIFLLMLEGLSSELRLDLHPCDIQANEATS